MIHKIYDKHKKETLHFYEWAELVETCLGQFEYTGLPDTVPAEYLEAYLLTNGTVAIGKVEGKDDVYCAMGSYNGDYNGYLPDSYTAAVNGIGEISGMWDAAGSIVVGINNFARLPDYDIDRIADILTECDTSEDINVLFSRFLRIPYADDETQKASIIAAVEAIARGDIKAVATRNAITEYLTNGGTSYKSDKFLDLVDPDQIKSLQYLQQYRDNIVKRFMMRRGYMYQVTTKLAQQTTAEIHGSDHMAMLYPLQQLKCRQQMIADCNKKFGWGASVEFNDVLKNNYDAIMSYAADEANEEGIIDENSNSTIDNTGDDRQLSELDSGDNTSDNNTGQSDSRSDDTEEQQ